MKNIRKIIIILSALFIIIMATVSIKDILAYTPPRKAETSEVGIYSSGIEIPLNRILLIRKDAECCALKFIKAWTELDKEELKKYTNYMNQSANMSDHYRNISTKKYAIYESYYQGDGTGNFTANNVKVMQKTASWLPLRGPFRPFIYQPGNARVECGSIKLVWQYITSVSFIPSGKYMGDYGFQLAPTPWTDIKEVNVKDPRIKWYRYDEKRERIFIPIDKLWEK
jgi:hypothetical protein